MQRAVFLFLLGAAACSASVEGSGDETKDDAVAPSPSPTPTSGDDAGPGPDGGPAKKVTFCETFDDDIGSVKKRWAGIEEGDGVLELAPDGVTGKALRSKLRGLGAGPSQARLWVELPSTLASDVEITFAFRLTSENIVGQDLFGVDFLSQKYGNVFSMIRIYLQNANAFIYHAERGGIGSPGVNRSWADGEWHKVRIKTHPIVSVARLDEVEFTVPGQVWTEGSARFHVGQWMKTPTAAIMDF